jgi:hypothetical protein
MLSDRLLYYFRSFKNNPTIQLRDRDLSYRLPSGFSIKSIYRGLKKAWTGYKIAKEKGDYDKMIYYAEGNLKFQWQLITPLSDFPELSLAVKEKEM